MTTNDQTTTLLLTTDEFRPPQHCGSLDGGLQCWGSRCLAQDQAEVLIQPHSHELTLLQTPVFKINVRKELEDFNEAE
ncbi:hypothetical protein AOLI_G00325150 [Acnodon oligacanthus]